MYSSREQIINAIVGSAVNIVAGVKYTNSITEIKSGFTSFEVPKNFPLLNVTLGDDTLEGSDESGGYVEIRTTKCHLFLHLDTDDITTIESYISDMKYYIMNDINLFNAQVVISYELDSIHPYFTNTKKYSLVEFILNIKYTDSAGTLSGVVGTESEEYLQLENYTDTKKLTQLTEISALTSNDLFYVVDAETSSSYKVKFNDMMSYITGSSGLGGWSGTMSATSSFVVSNGIITSVI